MADSSAVIEMIKRIIADDTADLRERVQHIESSLAQRATPSTPEKQAKYISMADPDVESQADPNGLQNRLDTIKALHRLDATPVQWTRGSNGQMVEAPEGLWEIACVVCQGAPVIWREGDSKPTQCRTWQIADGKV